MNATIFLRIWRFIRIPLGIILLLFIGLVIYRIPAVVEKQKTEEAVLRIHAQKITLDDVMGVNLPPQPDQKLNDSTIQGIDANQNGIRDDVELAIFKLYPDSARIRAAELQYAMALQMELTQVFNSETLVAVLQEKNRGYFCISNTEPSLIPKFDDLKVLADWLAVKENADFYNKESRRTSMIVDKREKEVEELVMNTDARKKKEKEVFKYLTSHGDREGEICDLDPVSLPN